MGVRTPHVVWYVVWEIQVQRLVGKWVAIRITYCISTSEGEASFQNTVRAGWSSHSLALSTLASVPDSDLALQRMVEAVL